MSRIIFLDFDGPLVPFAKKYQKTRPAVVSKEAIACLNVLIKESGAKIVVTSSWRTHSTLEQLQTLLNKKWGVVGEVVGKTSKSIVGSNRGREIESWLVEHQGEVESFVILDDEDKGMYPLIDRVVKIDNHMAGMRPVDVSHALIVLEIPS
jgi:trehalose-6-phosphatase